MEKFIIYVDGEYYDVQKESENLPLYSVSTDYGTAQLGYNHTEKRWKLNSDYQEPIDIDVDKVGKAIKEKLSIEG